LGKSVRVTIERDEVLFTQSDHAVLTHSNRGQLGGTTSAFMANHGTNEWRRTLFKDLLLDKRYAQPLPLVKND